MCKEIHKVYTEETNKNATMSVNHGIIYAEDYIKWLEGKVQLQKAGEESKLSAWREPKKEDIDKHELLGFSRGWIDEDYNPKGIRICFCNGDGTEWVSAKYNNYHDCYEEDYSVPELVRETPEAEDCVKEQLDKVFSIGISKRITCYRCCALKGIKEKSFSCELGYEIDTDKGVPLEKCPKPLTDEELSFWSKKIKMSIRRLIAKNDF